MRAGMRSGMRSGMTEGRPVLIAAGGTGGHVVPALAVANTLRERQVPVLWAGTRQGLESRMVPTAGIPMRLIDIRGLRGQSVLDTLLGPLRLLRAIVQSIVLLRSERVSAVLGMGGFVSGPVALAALMLRIPLVLHEQNAVAGMTNAWLARFATRVFSAFPDVFPASRSAETVGNPVPAGIVAGTTRIRQKGDPLRVLVIGGSRGAECLNRLLPEAMKALRVDDSLASDKVGSIEVFHQAGAGRGGATRERYLKALAATHKVSVCVEDFVDDMATAYSKADLVISRAGAMTVTELAASGTPALLVPFPYAVDDHQTANANWLVSVGAAVLLPEDQLDARSLAFEVEQLLRDPDRLDAMARAAHERFVPGAAARVADALCDAAGAVADSASTTSQAQSSGDSVDRRQHQLGGLR